MKVLGLPVIAIIALATPVAAQTVTPADLVGTWSGALVSKEPAKKTYTLIMKADSTYTETSNGTNDKEKPNRWRLWGDSIWFGKEDSKFTIKLQNKGAEFTLFHPVGTFLYKRVDTPKP